MAEMNKEEIIVEYIPKIKLINWKKIFIRGGVSYFSIMLLFFLTYDYNVKKWYYDDLNYVVLKTNSKVKALKDIEFQRKYKRDFENNYKIPFDLKKSDLRREKMSIFDHIKEFKVIALLSLLLIIVLVFIHCFRIYYKYWMYRLFKFN
jgi:hypothetical protein